MITFSHIEFLHKSKLDLPPVIYKYRDWEIYNHQKIITQREVFFASPNSFTDKLDCKIPVRYDLLTLDDVRFGYKFFNPQMSQIECDNISKDWILEGREKAMESQKRFMDDWLESYGVLSLTANQNNCSMWEDYSNNHRGFCVGFDTEIMFQTFGGGGNVIYCDDLPIIMPIPHTSFEERHVLQIYTKLRRWDKEQEYRAFKFSSYPLTNYERKVKLPPSAYKEIILGKNMPDSLAEDLLKSIPKTLWHIEILNEK